MSDLYQWDGSDTRQNQPPGQPSQPGGRDNYRWDGSDVGPNQNYQVAPPGYNRYQADVYQDPRCMPSRPREYWGGQTGKGGDIYITALPGSKVEINNGVGDVNMRGGMNYDYRANNGRDYDYRQYMPRQCYQPDYYQYRRTYCPQETVVAPNYYAPAQSYRNSNTAYGGRDGLYYNQTNSGYSRGGMPGSDCYGQSSGWNDAANIFGMALQGAQTYLSYDVARRYANHSNDYQYNNNNNYGGRRGNYVHGWQR